MKAILITYNQAHTERVEFLLDKLEIRGFTRWEDVQGRGTNQGAPHLGTHTWPEMNSATLTMVDDDKVEAVLESIKKLNAINEEVGIRAFVWEVLTTV